MRWAYSFRISLQGLLRVCMYESTKGHRKMLGDRYSPHDDTAGMEPRYQGIVDLHQESADLHKEYADLKQECDDLQQEYADLQQNVQTYITDCRVRISYMYIIFLVWLSGSVILCRLFLTAFFVTARYF